MTAGLVRRGAALARPYAMAMGLSAMAAGRDVGIAVLHGGDGTRAGEVASLLDARVGAPEASDLLVGVLRPGDHPSQIANDIGDHRRRGGDALVAIVGSPPQRRRLERELLVHPDIEMSVITHIDAWDSVGIQEFRKAVVRALGTGRVAAGQSHDALRSTVADRLERGAANRAALVAALPLNSGASMTLLSLIQARLASDISGLRQSKPDPRQAAVVAGTAVSAPLWRAFARRLIAAMPPLESVIRGGVAYTVTRGVAAVARRVVSGGQNLAREES